MTIIDTTNPFKIFLSHSSKDRGFSAEIYEHLRCIGIPVWFSPVEMPPAGVWYTDEEVETKLRRGMETCDSALFLVDGYALDSRWVNYEIKIADEIVHSKPDFKLIPIINDIPKSEFPQFIQALHPIDFNHGYKTALLELMNRLGLADKRASSVSTIGALIVRGSRSLQKGTDLASHLKQLEIPEQIKHMVLEVRDYLAGFEFRPDMQEITRWLCLWCSNQPPAKTLVEGNQWYSRIPQEDQFRLIFSALPVSLSGGESDDGGTPAAFIMTLIPPGCDPETETATSMLAQYGQDGSAYFWLINHNRVMRYSMGSANTNSILLSENRMMGASQMVMDLANGTQDSTMQMLMQMMQNKIGGGMLQNEETLHERYKEVKSLSGLLTKLTKAGWEAPETSQNDALWAHLTHGGILLYEVARTSGISPTLGLQIGILLKSAGAQSMAAPGDSKRKIYLSFSSLQSQEVSHFLGINPIALE